MLNRFMKWEHYKLFRTARYFVGGTLLIMLANIALSLLTGPTGPLMSLSFTFNLVFGLFLIIGMLLIWLFHFYRSLAGKEASTTMMIPLSAPRLLAGKLLPGFLQISATALAVNLVWALQARVAGYSLLPMLRILLLPFLNTAAASEAAVYLSFAAYELFLIAICQLGLASFILIGSGKAMSNLGVGGPIVVYVLYYLAFQALALIYMYLGGFLSRFMSAGNIPSAQIPAPELRSFALSMIALGTIYTISFFIGGVCRFVKRPFLR